MRQTATSELALAVGGRGLCWQPHHTEQQLTLCTCADAAPAHVHTAARSSCGLRIKNAVMWTFAMAVVLGLAIGVAYGEHGGQLHSQAVSSRQAAPEGMPGVHKLTLLTRDTCPPFSCTWQGWLATLSTPRRSWCQA
jgi:hypothetical protein